MINAVDMKDRVLKYIQKYNRVTFAEIEDLFEENRFPYKGNVSLSQDNNPKVLLWTCWNEISVGIIRDLLKEESIIMVPIDTLAYQIDGVYLQYPIANHRKRKYKTIHWLPVALCRVEKKKAIT